jgi:ribosomal protein L11 methylase PrmA
MNQMQLAEQLIEKYEDSLNNHCHLRKHCAQDPSFFDRDYFQNGLSSGKSLYESYRWRPSLTRPLAIGIQNFAGIETGDTVVDFGCARGYLVRTLLENGINAYGIDVSPFAINNSDPLVRARLQLIENNLLGECFNNLGINRAEIVIAKDVFEHIPPNQLKKLLIQLRTHAKRLYVLVPLGDEGVYRISDYEEDKSHIIAENESWWANIFESNKFRILKFAHQVQNVKTHALKLHPQGNGHFLLESK